jgi:hypothetical protein
MLGMVSSVFQVLVGPIALIIIFFYKCCGAYKESRCMLGMVSSLFQVPCGAHYNNNYLLLPMLRGLRGELLHAGHGEFTLPSSSSPSLAAVALHKESTGSSLFQVPCGAHCCNNHLSLRMLRGIQGESLHAGHSEFALSSSLWGSLL